MFFYSVTDPNTFDPKKTGEGEVRTF